MRGGIRQPFDAKMRQLFYHSTEVPGLNMDLFGGFLDWRFLAGADSLRGGEEAPQAEPLHLSRTSKYKVSKLDRWELDGRVVDPF